MLLDGPIYPFTPKNIDMAPVQHGLYVLYDGDTPIYIGRASGFGVSINSRLRGHLRGDEGPRTRNATHYQRLVTTELAGQEARLISLYRQMYGDGGRQIAPLSKR